MTGRWVTDYCSRCNHSWSQDYEEPPECPRCGWPFEDIYTEEEDEDFEYEIYD